MTSGVQQHVTNRVPNLSWRLQNPHVVAIRQDPSAPCKCPLRRPDNPQRDGLHPPSERVPILRLDNQMRMIPQERVMHQPKLTPFAAPRQRLLERPHESSVAERRNPAAHLQRHVAGVMRGEPRSTSVTDGGIRTWLTPRTLSALAKRQRELLYLSSLHHLVYIRAVLLICEWYEPGTQTTRQTGNVREQWN